MFSDNQAKTTENIPLDFTTCLWYLILEHYYEKPPHFVEGPLRDKLWEWRRLTVELHPAASGGYWNKTQNFNADCDTTFRSAAYYW